MKYLKAKNLLPEDLIKEIQKYVDGEFLYIPRCFGKEAGWGEKSGTRNFLKERNAQIYRKYTEGVKVGNLAEEYYLSEQSIRRIVSMFKNA